MEHQEFEAPVELQDTVKCFWYNRKDFGEVPSDFEVVPDGYAEIIFHFGSTLSISYGGVLHPLPSPFIMGLLNQPAVFNTKDTMEIIGIRCFPWTVFDLLGLPSGKDGLHLLEHPVTDLQFQLHPLIQAGQIQEAIALVTTYFIRLRSQVGVNTMLFKAGSAMRAASGTLPVSEVAASAHATIRTLERKFKQSSGYTVKDVSALMRFEQVRNHLWLYPDSNIAGLAQELGYTDQSHLSREFKRYTGMTPAAFARKTKREKQASDDHII